MSKGLESLNTVFRSNKNEGYILSHSSLEYESKLGLSANNEDGKIINLLERTIRPAKLVNDANGKYTREIWDSLVNFYRDRSIFLYGGVATLIFSAFLLQNPFILLPIILIAIFKVIDRIFHRRKLKNILKDRKNSHREVRKKVDKFGKIK